MALHESDESEFEILSSDAEDNAMESQFSEEICASENVSIAAAESIENDNQETLGRPKLGRKRKIPQQSREDRKRLYNNNQPHINTKGNAVQAKVFNENFICGCRKKCTNTVPIHLRRRLFKQYWSMGSLAGRCGLLLNCIAGKDDLLIRKKYFIFGREVCKVGLMRTLQINESRSRVALYKYKNCDTFVDCRGQTTGGKRKLSPAKKNEVLRHISSFPKYVSHYTRAQTDSKFLNPSLNLSKMYRLYKRKFGDPVSKSTYKKLFYKNFNLRFKPPKKDTCKKCDIFKAEIKDADLLKRHFLENWHDDHLKLADSLQTQMKNDMKESTNDPELECLSYDMEKILVYPKLPTSIVYYKRQLNFYNLGIHTGSTGKGLFNVWKETQASKGTQEVGSCLKKYIENISKRVRRLILWADSCGGQNRSIRLVLMMIHVLQHHPTLKTISLRYLESGHTFLPNDTEFGDLECALKRKQRIYTGEQYIKIMKNCRLNNKFEVNKMSTEDFFSIKKMEKLITNRKIDINKEKINWLQTHEIVLDKSHPTMIKMRRELTDCFQTVNIGKADGTVPVCVELDELWPEGRPLSKAKLEDLMELLKLVPNKYKNYYSFLGVVPTRDFDEDVDGFGEEIDFEMEK